MTNPKPVALTDEDMSTLAQRIADATPTRTGAWTSASRWADASSDAAKIGDANDAFVREYCAPNSIYRKSANETGAPINSDWDNAIANHKIAGPPVSSVAAASWADAVKRGLQ